MLWNSKKILYATGQGSFRVGEHVGMSGRWRTLLLWAEGMEASHTLFILHNKTVTIRVALTWVLRGILEHFENWGPGDYGTLAPEGRAVCGESVGSEANFRQLVSELNSSTPSWGGKGVIMFISKFIYSPRWKLLDSNKFFLPT